MEAVSKLSRYAYSVEGSLGRHVVLGVDELGRRVHIPASGINILIAGGSGAGKSYMAGLLAEQLISQSYSALVIDPKGDNAELQRLPNVLTFGSDGRPLPAIDLLARMLHSCGTSLVADLSCMDYESVVHYLKPLPAILAAQRSRIGLPQWLIVDEAHMFMGPDSVGWSAPSLDRKGYCFATWRPHHLPSDALSSIDVAIVANGKGVTNDEVAGAVSKAIGLPKESVDRHLRCMPQQALLLTRCLPDKVRSFSPSLRLTNHIRHARRLNCVGLPEDQRFHFRSGVHALTPYSAGSLAELEIALSRCDPTILWHHCPRNDFSRWIRDIFNQEHLAADIGNAESRVRPDSRLEVVETVRILLVGALQLAREPDPIAI